MAYPDNLFNGDQVDPEYGGESGAAFGGLAWTWISGYARAIATRFISHVRVPYSCRVVICQEAIQIGDLVGMDVSTAVVADSTARIVKMSTAGAVNGKLLGIALEAGLKVLIASGGAIPRAVTGLGSQTGGATLTIDFTTSKLKLAAGPDPVIGRTDPAGNAFLLEAGFLGA